MEPNRSHRGRFEAVSMVPGLADEDSIVDHLFDLPAAGDEGSDRWQADVTRRLEKVLAERIRARLEGKAA